MSTPSNYIEDEYNGRVCCSGQAPSPSDMNEHYFYSLDLLVRSVCSSCPPDPPNIHHIRAQDFIKSLRADHTNPTQAPNAVHTNNQEGSYLESIPSEPNNVSETGLQISSSLLKVDIIGICDHGSNPVQGEDEVGQYDEAVEEQSSIPSTIDSNDSSFSVNDSGVDVGESPPPAKRLMTISPVSNFKDGLGVETNPPPAPDELKQQL